MAVYASIDNLHIRIALSFKSERERFPNGFFPLWDNVLTLVSVGNESQTQRPMLWTHARVTVPAFAESIVVDLPVPCTFDFNVAATKYFYALEEGEVPLCLLFSGTVFYEAEEEGLQVGQIPWDKETNFRLPVRVWKEMMDHYYPNSAWLCLRKDVFDRLYRYKMRRGLPTWEQALESLLPAAEEQVKS